MKTTQSRKPGKWILIFTCCQIWAFASVADACQDDFPTLSPYGDLPNADTPPPLPPEMATGEMPQQFVPANLPTRRPAATTPTRRPIAIPQPVNFPQDDATGFQESPPLNPPMQDDGTDNGQPPGRDAADIQDISSRLTSVGRMDLTEEFFGWRGADGSGRSRFSNKLRSNWVMLDRNGYVHGSVFRHDEGSFTAIAGITVLILQNGFPVGTASTDEEGRYRITGIPQGSYTLVCYQKDAVAAFGIVVLKYNPANRTIATEINTAVAPKQGRTIRDLIVEFSPKVKFRIVDDLETGEAITDPKRLYGFTGLRRFQPESVLSTPTGLQQIAIRDDGRLTGRLHRVHTRSGRPLPVKNTSVAVLKGSQILGQTSVDQYGIFRFSKLTTGVHTLVAGGSDGLAIIGMELVESTPNAVAQRSVNRGMIMQTSAGGQVPVPDAPDELTIPSGVVSDAVDFCLVDPENIGWLNYFIQERHYLEVMAEPPPPASPQQQYPGNSCPGFGGDGFGPGSGCPICGACHPALCGCKRKGFIINHMKMLHHHHGYHHGLPADQGCGAPGCQTPGCTGCGGSHNVRHGH